MSDGNQYAKTPDQMSGALSEEQKDRIFAEGIKILSNFLRDPVRGVNLPQEFFPILREYSQAGDFVVYLDSEGDVQTEETDLHILRRRPNIPDGAVAVVHVSPEGREDESILTDPLILRRTILLLAQAQGGVQCLIFLGKVTNTIAYMPNPQNRPSQKTIEACINEIFQEENKGTSLTPSDVTNYLSATKITLGSYPEQV